MNSARVIPGQRRLRRTTVASIGVVGAVAAGGLAAVTPAVAATVPAPPDTCAVSADGSDYRLTWSSPSTDGGSAIRQFAVREHGFSNPVLRPSGTARTLTWTADARDADDVRFNVRAVNAVGASKPCVMAPLSGGTDPDPDPDPELPDTTGLPYSADSFFKSRVTQAPIDAARTTSFRAFMARHPDQGGAGITWPKVNVNPDWAMSYHVGKASDPIWKLTGGNTTDSRLTLLRTQGFHMADSVADTFPTGNQDRPGVMVDNAFGYTVQFADAVVNKATRTITVSNAALFWHDSNGLDYRNPKSDSTKNFSSRGRIPDAMVIRRDALDTAMTNNTGLGHVLHLFFVETNTAEGVVHPMVGDESAKAGWGAEGERIRLDPSINLVDRGLTGAALAVARTMQENGMYLGDNSGSSSQIKASQPQHYLGTNLATDVFRGKISWNDFQVVQKGWQ